MPTTYHDQFFIIDPNSPPPSGSILYVTGMTLVDQNSDGDFGSNEGDTINGSEITAVYKGDKITVKLPDGSTVQIKGATLYLDNGLKVFTPTDDSLLVSGSEFVSSKWVSKSTKLKAKDLGPSCFVRGTLIKTETGPRPIETLEEGDRVWTHAGGWQPILWISRRKVEGLRENMPVRIRAGALGNRADVRVSPQHRIVLSDWRAEMFFGAPQVLIAAKHLVSVHDDIHYDPVPEVEYLHILLDGHYIIDSEGLLSESFDPGGDFARLDPLVQKEAHDRFPHLFDAPSPTVLPVAKGHDVQALTL